jgi:hypothetical protein
MPKRRPGPFPLVPAPLSGSREQIREHRGGEARTRYGKAEASLEPMPTMRSWSSSSKAG